MAPPGQTAPTQTQIEALARQREAATLADQGLYRCNYCKQTKPLQEGIVISWGGIPRFAMCPACFPGRPMVIEQRALSTGQPGLHIGPLRPEDKPADILPVHSMAEADHLIGQAKFKKRSF